MKITVTQKDINRGSPGSCGKCPIALAVTRAFHYKWNVSVGTYWITLRKKNVFGFCRSFELPEKVTKFIASFDAYERVKPFSFNMEEIRDED